MILTDEFINADDLGIACRKLIAEINSDSDNAYRAKMFKLNPYATPFELHPPPSYDESQNSVMTSGECEGGNPETINDMLNKTLLSRREKKQYRRLTCISWISYRCWLAYILWDPNRESYLKMKEWFQALSSDEQVDEYELLLEEVEMLRPGATL